MEGFNKNEGRELDSRFNEGIYSKAIRAGKRTYFFDVKSTRGDEYYLTITESKKRFNDDGQFHFEKHKLFLYQEDFEKFFDGLQEVMTFINENQMLIDNQASDSPFEDYADDENQLQPSRKEYMDIDFDDFTK